MTASTLRTVDVVVLLGDKLDLAVAVRADNVDAPGAGRFDAAARAAATDETAGFGAAAEIPVLAVVLVVVVFGAALQSK